VVSFTSQFQNCRHSNHLKSWTVFVDKQALWIFEISKSCISWSIKDMKLTLTTLTHFQPAASALPVFSGILVKLEWIHFLSDNNGNISL
jgi:hypothetical protein